jgi:hypothetical protein
MKPAFAARKIAAFPAAADVMRGAADPYGTYRVLIPAPKTGQADRTVAHAADIPARRDARRDFFHGFSQNEFLFFV